MTVSSGCNGHVTVDGNLHAARMLEGLGKCKRNRQILSLREGRHRDSVSWADPKLERPRVLGSHLLLSGRILPHSAKGFFYISQLKLFLPHNKSIFQKQHSALNIQHRRFN